MFVFWSVRISFQILEKMVTRRQILGLVLIIIWFLTLTFPSLRYAPTTHILFMLRICTVCAPSLALTKMLAVVIILPTAILLTTVSIIRMELLDSPTILLVLGLYMIIDILLIRITYFEQVDSPFGRYLSSILIYKDHNRLCSICLDQIWRLGRWCFSSV